MYLCVYVSVYPLSVPKNKFERYFYKIKQNLKAISVK